MHTGCSVTKLAPTGLWLTFPSHWSNHNVPCIPGSFQLCLVLVASMPPLLHTSNTHRDIWICGSLQSSDISDKSFFAVAGGFLTLEDSEQCRGPGFIYASSVACENLQPKMMLSKSVLSRLPNNCVTVGMCLCMTPQVVSVTHLPRDHILMVVTQYQTLGCWRGVH